MSLRWEAGSNIVQKGAERKCMRRKGIYKKLFLRNYKEGR
jgi:hypothetical protein